MDKMDEAVIEAFLNAVKVSVDHKNDLPLETGKFWMDHMIPCKGPEVEVLDLKRSSYKKMGKFLAHLKKEGLIDYEEASKKDPIAKINSFDLGEDLIADWEPTIDSANNKTNDEESSKNKNKDFTTNIKISNLLMPKKNIFPFFPKHQDDDLYSKDKAEKVFMDYLRDHKLLEGKKVIVNEEVEKMFGSSLEDIIDVGRQDEEDEDDDKAKVRTDAS